MALAASHNQVCIVGVGARTPVGITAAASAAAARAGISALREYPSYVDKAGEKICVARDALLPSELGGVERFYALSHPAVEEALFPLGQANKAISIPLFLGLPEPRPGLPHNLAHELVRYMDSFFEATHVHVTTKSFSYGHSAGLMAMEEAWRQIRQGHLDFCLVGGVDSYLEAETLEWLDEEGQLMSAENRSGFPPGEGSGFCLLASRDAIHKLNLPVLAEVINVATSIEVNRMKTETVCISEGLSGAFNVITAILKLPDEKINAIYCDLNGERYRTEEFVFTALRHQTAFIDVHDTTHPADCWGDIGAASGPLFTCLAVTSSQRAYAKGPRALIWTSSVGGQRCAALLHLPIRTDGD